MANLDRNFFAAQLAAKAHEAFGKPNVFQKTETRTGVSSEKPKPTPGEQANFVAGALREKIQELTRTRAALEAAQKDTAKGTKERTPAEQVQSALDRALENARAATGQETARELAAVNARIGILTGRLKELPGKPRPEVTA